MTDRELLEAAAKAAGLHHKDGFDWLKNEQGFQWNPLEDDGDALRLAVKLRLEVCQLDDGGVDVTRYGVDEPFGQLLATEAGTDMYAATRRAIVRAAAAMAVG